MARYAKEFGRWESIAARGSNHRKVTMCLEHQEQVHRMARLHSEAWKSGLPTNAGIMNAIVDQLMAEGMTREDAWNVANDTISYMKRYF
jgi:hypothetical protein